jgi:hypothetical protein
MRKVGLVAAVICAACFMVPFIGGISLGMAQESPHLTAEQAIAANSKTEKLGGTYSVLREIPSNADTRRVGDQALAQAGVNHIELYENGILADILRSGGFLLLQILPPSNKANSLDPPEFVSIVHLVSLGSDGIPKNVSAGSGINLADAQELVKDTTEFVELLYSTPSTEESSLESRFYGGSFPEGDLFQGTLFAIPNSLQKLGANPNEVREAAALFGGYIIWEFRYALSMPAYAASPVTALCAAENKREALTIEFLRNNHMDPHFDFNLKNIRSIEQLQERVELLKKLDKFLEDALKNEGDPVVIKANLSIVTMPLGVEMDLSRDEGHYGSSTPSMLMFFWDRLATGGFAIKMITAAD